MRYSKDCLMILSLLPLFTLASCGLIPHVTHQPHLREGMVRFERAGYSVRGRPIEVAIFGRGEDVTMLLGSIHGNEPCGELLLSNLIEYLNVHTELLQDRTVIIVPVVNPDGLAKGTRCNANGVDLNRNFPSRNWRGDENSEHRRNFSSNSSPEPETRAVIELIERYHPDKIVSIHSPLNCIDYDGPGRDMALAMARFNGYKVKRLGSRHGSLGSYAGEDEGIPVITFELDRKYLRGSIPNSVWTKHKESLLQAIRYNFEQIGK